MVANGKAGMSIQVTGTLPGYVDAAKNPDDIATFPFPASDKADDLKIAAGISAGLGVSAKTEKMEQAKAFMKWLGEPKQMAVVRQGRLRGAAGLDRRQARPAGGAVRSVRQGRARRSRSWTRSGRTRRCSRSHFAGIQELFAGKTNIPGLLKSMDEAYEQK